MQNPQSIKKQKHVSKFVLQKNINVTLIFSTVNYDFKLLNMKNNEIEIAINKTT